MRIAYLINQYPSVSHTFIRREIEAIERLGVIVDRISVRGWNLPLVDADDKRERLRTRYLLQKGSFALLRALCSVAITSPKAFLRTVRLTRRMATGSDKSYAIHLAYLAEACLLGRWLKETGATHLHAHFATNPAEVALYVHSLTRIGYSFTGHGSDIMDKPSQMKLEEKISSSKFTAAVCSYGRAQMYRWIDHRQWGKVHIVHCGLQFSPVSSTEDKPERRPGHFVCVGRLSKEKGQILLLQAIRALVDKGHDVHVTLVGDGPMRADLESYINVHQLQKYIHITGWLDNSQVQEELESASALVVPSLSEGLPIVIMEAMANDLTVIAPYLAGIPELVIDGKTGWLYPSGDAHALANAMEASLSAPESIRENILEHAKQQVMMHHNVDTEAKKLLRYITET